MGNSSTPTIMTTDEMMTVPRKTSITVEKSVPRLLVFSRLAIDDDMVKKMSGMMAVNSRFKKMSPSGLMLSTFVPKTNPRMLPRMMPDNKKMMLL